MGSVAKTVSKLIPHEITNTLDKIIPNEIKPALPFAAAAFPFLAPEVFAGIGSLGGAITNPIAQRAIAGGLLNLGSQVSQEGYDKRGINPMSLGLGTLGGALTTPSSDLNSLMATGTPYNPAGIGSQTGFYPGSAIYPGTLDLSNVTSPTLAGYSLNPTALDAASANIGSNLGTDYSTLDKIQNSIVKGTQSASDFFNKGVTGFENEGILSKDFLKAYAPGAIVAASDLAYNAAKDKALEFEKQQAALGQTATANKQAQIDYIRKAMQTAGFTSTEIDDALRRSGFADGGRAGYGLGGEILKALGDTSKNIRYRGLSEGLSRTLNDIKKPFTDRLARKSDDIQIRLGNHDFEDSLETGPVHNFDVHIKPLTKKGEKIMQDISKADKEEFGKPLTKTDQGYLVNENGQDEFSYYIDKALGKGAKASGIYHEPLTGGEDIFLRPQNKYRSPLYQSSYDPEFGYPERDLYESLEQYRPIKKAEGGLMSLHGHEMDFRDGGGFVPIGKKERADDVPARLSKNEFVFTANAVRNAGHGDIKEGAKRMYQLMKHLEAK